MRNSTKALVLFLLTLLAIAPNVGAIGVGVAPSKFTIHDALRGREFERTITIFNVENETARLALNATGDIKDWVSFHEIDNEASINTTLVPSGSKKIVIRFTVPSNVASGSYTSTIYVQTIPEELTESTGAAAVMGVRVPVEAMIIVTGTQILTGWIQDISTMDVEVNYPLRIKVDFQNTGNVIARPIVAINITKNKTLIDSFVYSQTEIKPNSKETISIEWDTTGNEAGDHVANVSVSLGEEVLSEKDLQFNILAEGTLTRQGELNEIFYIEEPLINRYIKILVEFENTGMIDSNAQFKGEIYVDEGLVDVIESDELTVPPKETGTLTSYLNIQNPGDYTIRGYVIYDGKKTETREISFGVPAVQSGSQASFDVGMLAIVAVIVLLIIVFGVFISKKPKKEIKKRKKEKIKEKQKKESKKNITQNKEDILNNIKKHLSTSTAHSSKNKKKNLDIKRKNNG